MPAFTFSPACPRGSGPLRPKRRVSKNWSGTGIEIFIAQRQALDLQLEVGDVKQSVEVTANQTLLDTETSERGQTLTPKMYQTLPLWSGGLQNPSAFLGYMAGVNRAARPASRVPRDARANN